MKKWKVFISADLFKEVNQNDQYQEALGKLEAGLKSARLERLQNNGMFSIRVKGKDYSDRLLLCKKGGQMFLIGVAENHDYESHTKYDSATSGKMLKIMTGAFDTEEGEDVWPDQQRLLLKKYIAKQKESKPAPVEESFCVDVDENTYFTYYNNSVIELSHPQTEVLDESLTLPAIINGTAGSGKTLVACELLVKKAREGQKVYYFAPSDGLVRDMRENITRVFGEEEKRLIENIVITTYQEFIRQHNISNNIVGIEKFKEWYDSIKKKSASKANITDLSAEQIYQEMTVIAAQFLMKGDFSLDDYQKLGERQSSIPTENLELRKAVFEMFNSYKNDLTKNNTLDIDLLPSILKTEEVNSEKANSFIVVDECQSLSHIALKQISDLSGDDIIFMGDSFQGMLNPVSNVEFIKSLYIGAGIKSSRVTELSWNSSMRCPPLIWNFAREVLGTSKSSSEKGSLPDEAELSKTKNNGQCYYYDKSKVKTFYEAQKQQILKDGSLDTVVIVPNQNMKEGAQAQFGDRIIIVTPEEFLGMERSNVILYKCFEVLLTKDQQNQSYSCNNTNLHKLFVALTRSKHSLHIVEPNSHIAGNFLGEVGLNEIANKSTQDVKPAELEEIRFEDILKAIHDFAPQNNNNALITLQDAIKKFPIEKHKDLWKAGLEKLQQYESVKNNADVMGEIEKIVTEMDPISQPSQPSQQQKAIAKILSSLLSRDDIKKLEDYLSGDIRKQEPLLRLLQNKKGAISNINIYVKNGFTPLHLASQKGHIEIAKLLIEKEANVNATATKDGSTPLHLAIQNGHIEIAKLLIEKKANVNATATKDNFTPLHLAIQEGHIEIAKLLIEKKANVNAAAKDSFTPLHLAIQEGHIEIAKLLIEKEANVNAATKDGFTPLHLAIQNGHIEIAKLLIEKKANVNAATKNGFTPLHLVAQYGRIEEIAELLIEKKANVNAADKDGYTTLHLASQNGHIKIAELLIDRGANVNATETEDSFTSLHLASQNGHIKIAELLIKKKADVNAADKDGFTSLHLAMQEGHIEIVELLIDRGADFKGIETELLKNTLTKIKNALLNTILNHLTDDQKRNITVKLVGILKTFDLTNTSENFFGTTKEKLPEITFTPEQQENITKKLDILKNISDALKKEPNPDIKPLTASAYQELNTSHYQV